MRNELTGMDYATHATQCYPIHYCELKGLHPEGKSQSFSPALSVTRYKTRDERDSECNCERQRITKKVSSL